MNEHPKTYHFFVDAKRYETDKSFDERLPMLRRNAFPWSSAERHVASDRPRRDANV